MRGIPRQSYLDCIPGKLFSARSVSLAHWSMTEVWTLGSTMYDFLVFVLTAPQMGLDIHTFSFVVGRLLEG